jgi:hypothetical protein
VRTAERIFILAILNILSWHAVAQEARYKDYSSLLTGQQIANSCLAGYNEFDEKMNCSTRIINKLNANITNTNTQFELIGFVFQMFMFVGQHEEMVRNNPRYSDQFKRDSQRNVEAYEQVLQTLTRRLSVPLSDLCRVTQTDCSVASRLEQQWGMQVQQPAVAAHGHRDTSAQPSRGPETACEAQRVAEDESFRRLQATGATSLCDKVTRPEQIAACRCRFQLKAAAFSDLKAAAVPI